MIDESYKISTSFDLYASIFELIAWIVMIYVIL